MGGASPLIYTSIAPLKVRKTSHRPKAMDCHASIQSEIIFAAMKLSIEIDREDDGRWICEVPELPGVTVYQKTRKLELASVQALALRVIADRLES